MLLEKRKYPRIPERFLVVQIRAVRDSRQELATMENVSSHGTRLATERPWQPGSHVILESFTTRNPWATRARVVYCQANGSKEFAVGLNFLTQTSD